MPEQRKPMVTELALADALNRLVNLIEELRADADLHVEITTDETSLVKLAFSGTPDVGFAMRREVRDIPGEVVRRIWNEGLRDYDIGSSPPSLRHTTHRLSDQRVARWTGRLPFQRREQVMNPGASKARLRRPTLTCASTPASTRRSMAWQDWRP